MEAATTPAVALLLLPPMTLLPLLLLLLLLRQQQLLPLLQPGLLWPPPVAVVVVVPSPAEEVVAVMVKALLPGLLQRQPFRQARLKGGYRQRWPLSPSLDWVVLFSLVIADLERTVAPPAPLSPLPRRPSFHR